MAGMLPGVECARRRGFHLGCPVDSSTSSRRSSFCLYTTGHDTHLSSKSTVQFTFIFFFNIEFILLRRFPFVS
ncbi:hypothetical protein GW17_00049450 [Ensete ventricosum]|nr:hypothetical protein GW17_00049450 [Ensete ventricosum]